MSIKVALVGYGKMGQAVEEVAQEMQATIVARIDPKLEQSALSKEILSGVDVCIDFTTPGEVVDNIEQYARWRCPAVVGTTGWDAQKECVQQMVAKHESALVWGQNFSLGVNLFMKLVQEAAHLFTESYGYDVAICETHHKQKVDRPSGTALHLAHLLQKEVEIASTRVGYDCGQHEVVFDSKEDRVVISHTSRSRLNLARGALKAAHWIVDKKGFFHFSEVL